MHLQIFLQQLRRGKKKTTLYILLLTAVTAFFVMSVNLYQNSVANLEAVEENYSTIAVMELYGDVNSYGELVDMNSEDHSGYKSVAVEGYDISEIVTADGVIIWDLRSKYAAYIENEPAMWNENSIMAKGDVIRFKIAGDKPVEIPILWNVNHWEGKSTRMKLEVLDSAAGCFEYNGVFNFTPLLEREKEIYADQIKQLNRSEETEKIILYPDVEYITTLSNGVDWKLNDDTGILEVDPEQAGYEDVRFHPGQAEYATIKPIVGYGSSEYISSKDRTNAPFPIQRWEDVQNDPEMKEYFDGVWAATPITVRTFSIDLTNDFTSIPVYHLGGMSLKEGRLITEKEYESGAKVCLASDQTAELQGWTIGDKLDMSFYEFEAMGSANDEWGFNHPFWHRDTEGFFDESEYEIVGIYTQNPIIGNSDVASSTLAMPWYTIYVPENSVKVPIEPEEKKVHGALLSIRLENGSIDRFLADMEELGLTEEKEGQYNPKFTFYDQGYSIVQPGLEAMNGTAKLLLVLSAILLLVTCILLAFFFAQNQKQSVGIFRMLGGTKLKAISAVLVCALLVTIIGSACGAVVGYQLAQEVGESIIEKNLEENQQAAFYQAYVVQSSGEDEPVTSVQASVELTAAASTTVLIFPILMLIFVVQYIGKEPRALLPKSGG